MIEERLKDYLVENPNLFEEVMKKINGFTILNECDFSLSDYFINNGGPVFIHLTLKEHALGEIVHVLLKYKEKEISFDIPLLVKAYYLKVSKGKSKLWGKGDGDLTVYLHKVEVNQRRHRE